MTFILFLVYYEFILRKKVVIINNYQWEFLLRDVGFSYEYSLALIIIMIRWFCENPSNV